MKNNRRGFLAAVVVVMVLLIGAVCVWRFGSGDMRAVNMSAEELERYWPYAAAVDEKEVEKGFNIYAHIVPSEYQEEINAQLYASDTLEEYLYRCEAIREIVVFNKIYTAIHVTYQSEDGIEVWTTLHGDGTLASGAVYDPGSDTFYNIDSKTEGYKYTHFRHGSSGRKFYPPER